MPEPVSLGLRHDLQVFANMYVIQLWDESGDRYLDLHVDPARDAPRRFARASRAQPATLYSDGHRALEASRVLEERYEIFLTVLDRSTGQRVFDDYQLDIATVTQR